MLRGHWDKPADDADFAEFLVAFGDESIGRQFDQRVELIGQRLGDTVAHSSRVTVGTAERLWNDFVHDAESHEVLRGHA